MADFGPDRCKGCGAEWVGHAGAFACGYPLADCAAAVSDEEEDHAWRAMQDEARALEALIADVVAHGTPEDVLAMDELEAELDARFEARFPRIEVATFHVEGDVIDIPF